MQDGGAAQRRSMTRNHIPLLNAASRQTTSFLTSAKLKEKLCAGDVHRVGPIAELIAAPLLGVAVRPLMHEHRQAALLAPTAPLVARAIKPPSAGMALALHSNDVKGFAHIHINNAPRVHGIHPKHAVPNCPTAPLAPHVPVSGAVIGGVTHAPPHWVIQVQGPNVSQVRAATR